LFLHFHLAVVYSQRLPTTGFDGKADCHERESFKAALQFDNGCLSGRRQDGDSPACGGSRCNARDCDGDTALALAAERGHIELVKVLLKNGADVNAKNLNGVTALMRAAENDRAAAVKILLAHHANCDAGDIINCTPLMRAAYRGHVDVVKELLAHGADANARNAFGSASISLIACGIVSG
jgi:uncharacterized protein